MEKLKLIKGDLIALALTGAFDVIAHGCNCFCNMGAGIAPQMKNQFGCDKYPLEDPLRYKGAVNKLGQIEYGKYALAPDKYVTVVNAYTQYGYGKNHTDGVSAPLDYEALTLCMRKMNQVFRGQHIGLPLIGCGLAGGNWEIVRSIIARELKDTASVTIVQYQK